MRCPTRRQASEGLRLASQPCTLPLPGHRINRTRMRRTRQPPARAHNARLGGFHHSHLPISAFPQLRIFGNVRSPRLADRITDRQKLSRDLAPIIEKRPAPAVLRFDHLCPYRLACECYRLDQLLICSNLNPTKPNCGELFCFCSEFGSNTHFP